jgi:hypothetical protein
VLDQFICYPDPNEVIRINVEPVRRLAGRLYKSATGYLRGRNPETGDQEADTEEGGLLSAPDIDDADYDETSLPGDRTEANTAADPSAGFVTLDDFARDDLLFDLFSDGLGILVAAFEDRDHGAFAQRHAVDACPETAVPLAKAGRVVQRTMYLTLRKMQPRQVPPYVAQP